MPKIFIIYLIHTLNIWNNKFKIIFITKRPYFKIKFTFNFIQSLFLWIMRSCVLVFKWTIGHIKNQFNLVKWSFFYCVFELNVLFKFKLPSELNSNLKNVWECCFLNSPLFRIVQWRCSIILGWRNIFTLTTDRWLDLNFFYYSIWYKVLS